MKKKPMSGAPTNLHRVFLRERYEKLMSARQAEEDLKDHTLVG